MAKQPDQAPDEAADEAADVPQPGEFRRYPVPQGNGTTRHQVVLITHAPDDEGLVRGRALCYEDELAAFLPEQFA